VSVTFIAISGASGSGKTLFANTIIQELTSAASGNTISVLHEDAYYKDQSHLPLDVRAQTNFDHPNAFDHDLMAEHLSLLGSSQAVQSPIYDYTNHTRSEKTQEVKPSKVVLVEGILLLSHAGLRSLFDTRVFIDTPLDICLIRRLQRDIKERGRSMESVIEQYEKTVRPMYLEFVEPSKIWADVIIPQGGLNRVAIDLVKNRIISLLI